MAYDIAKSALSSSFMIKAILLAFWNIWGTTFDTVVDKEAENWFNFSLYPPHSCQLCLCELLTDNLLMALHTSQQEGQQTWHYIVQKYKLHTAHLKGYKGTHEWDIVCPWHSSSVRGYPMQ